MLYLQIKEEIKSAMKIKDTNKKDVLKMVVDKAKAIVKEKNPTDIAENIPDDIIIQAVQKEIKQLNQTKDALKGRENSDLYVSTVYKTEILRAYLPVQMTENELEKYITDELIKLSATNLEISPKSKGFIMKNLMPKLKGKADSRMINQIVDKLLNN